jgi:hypothetical protein
MVNSLRLNPAEILRQNQDLELAALPNNNLGIHLIDPVDQIYSYKGVIGKIIGWILYHFGHALRFWDEETQQNSYYSLSSTLQWMVNSPNKNLNGDPLASSAKLRGLVKKLFSHLESLAGDQKVTTENFREFVHNFRSQKFLADLQTANNPAHAEKLIEEQFQPFFREILLLSSH